MKDGFFIQKQFQKKRSYILMSNLFNVQNIKDTHYNSKSTL